MLKIILVAIIILELIGIVSVVCTCVWIVLKEYFSTKTQSKTNHTFSEKNLKAIKNLKEIPYQGH